MSRTIPNGRLVVLLLIALLLLSSCRQAEQMVGMRPASRLPAVVEAYLQKYQPGPLPRLFQTTYLYDRNGVQIAELFDEGRRTWVSIDRINQNLLDATIATEDSTFYTNVGIDPFRIIAALWNNTSEGRIISGASTITMQLARNLFLGPDQRYDASMDRKVLEAGLAQELTSLFTKDEILEMYLNLLNYGNLAYGPEAAAQVYFGKHASDLTAGEATFLAGIPQAPATFDPFRNFSAVKERQSVVLEIMVRHGFLDKSEADAIFLEPITLKTNIDPAPNLAPHFVQYVISEIDSKLGTGYIRRSGFNLFTTLDLRMQNLAQKLVAERIVQGRSRYNMNNGALIALRPGTAEVLAMVGSADFNDTAIAGQVNVTLAPRQPGSAIKPVLYVTAFNDLLLSPASAMWDLPVTYDLGGDQFYRPTNYDNKFHGLVTARTALANSYNVPAVRLLDALGMKRALSGAEALGIHSWTDDPSRYNLSLALGGQEVSLLELATAYHTIADGGQYIPPQVAQTFLDSQSQLIQPLAAPEPVRVVSPGAAFLVTDILSDNSARAPMFGTNSPLKLSRPAAVKTGTTTSFRDNWTVGFTRYLLAGVWVGNSNGQPMRNTTGVTGAAPIWHDFMEAVINSPELLKTLGVPADDPAAWDFPPPPDVEKSAECPLNLSCRQDGEYFTHEWMLAAGADGPLADMFSTEPTVPVHADRAGNPWGPVYCSQPGGQERKLFRLADVRGLADVAASRQEAQTGRAAGLSAIAPAGVAAPADNALQQAGEGPVVIFYPDKELERMRRIQWARSRNLPINVGPCASLQYYTVQNGEYWGILARRFNLTQTELQAANPQALREEGVLRPGDRLLVPTGVAIKLGGQGDFYTVQTGDSWAEIARRLNMPLRLLQTVNPQVVRPYYLLKPGDQIFIPNAQQLAAILQ